MAPPSFIVCMLGACQLHRHGLDLGVGNQRFESLLPAITRPLKPTKGKFHAPAGSIAVDIDLTSAEFTCQPMCLINVVCPYGSNEAVPGPVRQGSGLPKVTEGRHTEHGAKDLLLRDHRLGPHLVKERGQVEEAVRQMLVA